MGRGVIYFILLICSVVHAGELKIAIISDLNGSYGSMSYSSNVTKAVKKLIADKPDLILSTGDMVAGMKRGLNYKGMWESFHSNVTLPLQKAGLPIFVTAGNHDASAYKTYASERVEFVSQWQKYKPKAEYVDDTHYPLMYAFKKSNNLFVSLDLTTIGKIPQKQIDWLEGILENSASYENRIVFGHLPVVPVARTKESEYVVDSRLMEMLKKYNVDYYLNGHHHVYYPGEYNGIKQISQGCLGGGARKLIGTDSRQSQSYTILTLGHKHSIKAIKASNGSEVDHFLLPQSIKFKSQKLLRID